jgi:hypothetical protein
VPNEYQPGWFEGSHWDEPNVLAHVRFNDRVDSSGKKTLFLEEVQSDWHEQGRERGYESKELSAERAAKAEALKEQRKKAWEALESAEEKIPEIRELRDLRAKVPTYIEGPATLRAIAKLKNEYVARFGDKAAEAIEATSFRYGSENFSSYGLLDAIDHQIQQAQYVNPRYMRASQELNRITHEQDAAARKTAIPAAPFAKTWHELVMKRMLRWAAENGYDKLAWTTGEQQAERYNQLLRNIDTIRWEKSPEKEGTYDVAAVQKGRTIGSFEGLDKDALIQHVGKNMAAEILESPHEMGSLTGKDISIGGSGMKGFYDKMLPDFLNRYGKRWGAKVGEAEIRLPSELGSEVRDYVGPTATPESFEGWLRRRQIKWESGAQGWATWNVTRDQQAKKVLGALKAGQDFKAAMQQHGSDDLATQFGGEMIISKPTKGEKVHSIDITPSMKQSVLEEGQPISSLRPPGGQPPPPIRQAETAVA